MKKMEADVIVVAAGLSGLAAAISAAEGGANVIAFEKASITGGAANMGMGPLGVGTRYQRNQMVSLTPGEAFRKHMNFVHWRADARLVRDYYFKSNSTIEWLEDMGVEFFMAMSAYAAPENMKSLCSAEATGHVVKPEGGGPPGPRVAATMIKRMTERARELGVDIQLETPVKSLIIEDGKAAGVIAQDKDGEEVEARAKAVIIGTGGFGDNPDWIKKYMGFEWGKDLFSFRVPGMMGDGLKMAWEAGAAKTDLMLEVMYQIPDNMEHFVLDGAFRQPCLWVNVHGDRFMNEDGITNSTFTGNAIINLPKRTAFSIFDGNLLKHYKKNGPDFVTHVHGTEMFDFFDEEVEDSLAEGYDPLIVADSIEELAEKAGIDVEGLKRTIEEYNEMCANGHDELFEKEYRYMQPISSPKYYCLKYYPAAYGTLGGIKINYRTEVQSEAEESIPGLYACGVDACTIFGDTYPFILGGNTMGFCLNSGRIAGENAADYVFEG